MIMPDDDTEDLDWHEFPEGREPTEISEFCNNGKRDECVGRFCTFR
jgi:hypothetical protein